MAVASAVGTTIEWYDYFIYSTAAALIFGSQFFSALSPASGTLAAFATLGVGFLARPVGGVLWGHFGDRIGRKAMLVASLLVMGLATVGVGLLPTYDQIGLLAPVLLLVLRLLQGLSAGGEWGGAALMAVEHAPAEQRGRYGSFSQIGVPAGLILAQLVFFVVGNALSDEQFAAWGWRLPFLFASCSSGSGCTCGCRSRRARCSARCAPSVRAAPSPIVEVFRERPRALVVASVSFIANTAIGYVFLAYLLSYGTSVLKVSRNLMLVVVIVGSVCWLVSIVVAGDLVGPDRPPAGVPGRLGAAGALVDPVLPAPRLPQRGADGHRGARAHDRPRCLLRPAVGAVRGAVRGALPLQRRLVLLRRGRGARRRVRAADRDRAADRRRGPRCRCPPTWSWSG